MRIKKKNSLGLLKSEKDTSVVVAMSGGVDSSTVAGIMKKEGYNVIGINLTLYDEIKASNLVEITLAGEVINSDSSINNTGYIIHGAIHQARKDIVCVIHTHSRAGLAISCLKDGLKPMIQDTAIFHNRISYHDWEGMSTESDECERLAKSLGNNKVMILRNHGLLTCGTTIGEAFMLMYYLDRACKNQIDVLSTGMEPNIPSDNLMEYAAGQYEDPQFQLGKHEWPALLRLLDDNKSIYKQ